MTIKFKRSIVLSFVLLLALAACGGDEVANNSSSNNNAAANVAAPTDVPATDVPVVQLEEHRQWAVSATASSEYGADNWSADQAVGAPNTDVCGDEVTAWASEFSDSVETLELTYSTPVYATGVNIHESFNPDQVVEVQLIDVNGSAYVIYTATPEDTPDLCPLILELTLDQTDFMVTGVLITIDQSVLLTGWNEIDAVELVGMVDPANIVVDAGDASEAEEPAEEVTYEIPDGYLWSKNADDWGAGAIGDMDVDANGLLYVTDNFNGVLVFDADGNQVNRLDHSDINNASDVAIGPNGNVYVSSWGSDEIYVFSPGGELITKFGEGGNGPGQFGWSSPKAIAVGLDGTVYALDDNEDDAEENFTRIIKFSSDGVYLGEWLVDEGFFAPTAMDVGPDGNLYVLGFIGGYIIKYDSNGTIIGRLGDAALDFTGPQALDFDAAGNIYVSIWTDASIIKLDPNGNFVSSYGFEVELHTLWPEGAFYQPFGVAVMPDGSQAFAGDWNGDHYFITGFEMP